VSCSASGGVITCTCQAGYTGTYCQNCAGGYHWEGDVCVADESCTPDPCVNGDCSVSGGIASCACDYGWSGDTCNTCAPGFHLDAGNCVLDVTCLASTCSFHEVSCSASGGVITCTCQAEYTGTYCQNCATGYHRDAFDDCVANEVCDLDSCNYAGACDDSTGVIVCSCDTGYAGPTCAYCQDGFQDNNNDGVCRLNCALANPPCDQGSCSDASGTAICVCNSGWSGSLCATCNDDSFEPNNGTFDAKQITAPSFNDSLVLCRNNEDWFFINLVTGHEITVTLNHINASGNIDIFLYREYPFNLVAWSSTTNNIEQMIHLVNVGEAGKYFIRVRTPSTGFRRNTYSLNVTLTSTVCPTCEELGVDCGLWDNGCGIIDCTALHCDGDDDHCEQHVGDWVGNCAQYFDDLIYGCCDGNILNIVDYGYSVNCAGIGAVCSWVTDTWSSGGETYSGYFWCVPPASYESTPPHLEACPGYMAWAP
jgi:hypothetical protein